MSSVRSNPSLRSNPNKKPVLGVLTQAPPPKQHKRFSFLYTLLNPRSQQWHAVLFKQVISTVIVLDLLSFILETDDDLKDYHQIFQWMEIISSNLFLLEYMARVWTCMEKPRFRQQGPILGRIKFMLTSTALIDAMATLPYFLEPLVGVDLPRLTYLRFLRILRITKTHAGMRATDAVYRVVYYNREILYVAAYICILLVMTTGVALYYLRPPDDGVDGTGADEHFKSMLSTMYLSTLMLTGQGGPEGELPWYTKTIVLMTSIVSIAVFAIPGAMFTWGFEAEAERMAKRAHALRQRQESGTLDMSDDDYSTDEEYQKIIAGEDDDEDSEDGWPKELLEKFKAGDVDGDGTLTLKEFVQLSTSASLANLNGGGGDSPVLTGMMCRVQQLERNVKSNSEKLDKILELLESKKDK